jgi:hypothetical protein
MSLNPADYALLLDILLRARTFLYKDFSATGKGFNDDTYNMVNAQYWDLPFVFINGTIGKEILSDINNYRLGFYLNQTYKEIESKRLIITPRWLAIRNWVSYNIKNESDSGGEYWKLPRETIRDKRGDKSWRMRSKGCMKGRRKREETDMLSTPAHI